MEHRTEFGNGTNEKRSLAQNEDAPIQLPIQSIPMLKQNHHPYGAAVDLGTTQIRISLWDMEKKHRIAERSGLNPQGVFGADVLTRVAKASESPQRAREIGQLARDAIGASLQNMISEVKPACDAIGSVVIVGNTAMLTLLTGQNYTLLLRPDHWMREISCLPQDINSWLLSWGLDESADMNIIQPLAGFVGSDLLAGVLAANMTQDTAGTLLIDFGTNSEIALWDGSALWVTSAAGGPAFEGCGLSCGMTAGPGAIYKIEYQDTASENNCPDRQPCPSEIPADRAVRGTVIGGGQAVGLCGSGLVDIIAYLRKAGFVKSHGIFSRNVGKDGFFIARGERNIFITQRDIDVFQRAKAAIGAGIECLLKETGMNIKDVQRLCVCGAFGRFLNTLNAQQIGLLPSIDPQYVELWGNAALAGCELLLFSPERDNTLNALRKKIRVLNMASVPAFEELFFKHLYLRPMQVE